MRVGVEMMRAGGVVLISDLAAAFNQQWGLDQRQHDDMYNLY